MDCLKYYEDMTADEYIKDVKKNWFKMWEFWKEFLETHDATAFSEKTGDYEVDESNFSFTFQNLRYVLCDEAVKIEKRIKEGIVTSKYEKKIRDCYNDAWKIWEKCLKTPINGKEEGYRIIGTYRTEFSYYLGRVAVYDACHLSTKLEREGRPASVIWCEPEEDPKKTA